MHAERNRKAAATSFTELSYLGYGEYGAAMNMALDEAMRERSSETGAMLVRFYDFKRKSVIYSKFDDASIIKRENADGIEITRRESGGRPIYLSSNVLCYSIAIPERQDGGSDDTEYGVHQRYGRIMADTIAWVAGMGSNELELPGRSSIRFMGEPLAGHAQWRSGFNKGPTLYHGIIVVAPWDAEEIGRIWNIDKKELGRIAGLPSVMGIARRGLGSVAETKLEIVNTFLALIGKRDAVPDTNEDGLLLSRAARLAADKYANDSWVFPRLDSEESERRTIREQRLRNVPFCILWEDSQKPPKVNPRLAESDSEKQVHEA